MISVCKDFCPCMEVVCISKLLGMIKLLETFVSTTIGAVAETNIIES